MPNTPSTDEMDTNDTILNRRSSSGGLLSPEVDMMTVPRSSIDIEQDGFYLLKKDSQRRLTLSRVLEQDCEKICSKWMLTIQQDFGNTVLTMNHLETLRCALKEYIMDQNRSVIERAIITLKEDLDFDSNAINELHSAIYMFQEAVNVVLRMHSIKPHWMFALDNLVRNAVQAAITVLSPELGANLAGQEAERRSVAADASPSALSTATDTRDPLQIHQLRQENHKLQQELIDSYQQYQSLLRLMLEEQKSQTLILKEIVENKTSQSCASSVWAPCPALLSALVSWTRARGVPDAAAQALADQHYDLHDLLRLARRDDLARLKLPGGVELRLWQAILDHRAQNNLRRTSSTETDIDNNTMVVVECQKCKSSRTTNSCSDNPTIVIRDQQLNGDDTVAEYYTENGIVNL